jgi:CO/xanthine dehydrogenase Mo-binding subunit
MGHASVVDSPMPTRLDLPMIAPVVVEGPNTSHPVGVPGVGEVPVIPAMAAMSNALNCAMGVRMHQPAMAPGCVLEAWWARGGAKSTGRSSCQRGDFPPAGSS